MKRLFFHSPIFFGLLLFFGCSQPVPDSDLQRLNFRHKAVAARDKGQQFLSQSKPDSAFANFLKAKEAFMEARDSTSAAHSLLLACDILYDHNDYNELQSTAVEALGYLNPRKDASYFPSTYNYIGLSCALSSELDSAEANYSKVKRYARTDLDKATVENNIAQANIIAGKFDRAYQILSEAKRKFRLPDSDPITSKILDNYGYSAIRSGLKADGNPMEEALEIRRKNSDSSGLVTSLLNLAEVESRSSVGESLKKAIEAEQISRRLSSGSDRLQALRFLIDHSDAVSSQKYASSFIRISDSLQGAERKVRNTFALIKYNFRKERDRRIVEQGRAGLLIQNERLNRIALTLLSLLLAGVLLLTIAYFVKRSKRIRQNAEYETEVRISQRLHDDLANEVHRTIVFAETQQLDEPKNKEALLDRLEVIYDGTRNISRDHSDVPADADFAQLVRELLLEYNSEDCAVIAQGIASVKWEKLGHSKRIECYRILQELLLNMRKHSKCSHAVFAFSSNGKNAVLRYSDNGVGNDDFGQTRKNGLRIMENRILQLKGTCTFESVPGNGFRAKVEFPI